MSAPDSRPDGRGRPTADGSFGTWLRRTFGAPSYTPPVLPAVALEVHDLVRRPNVRLDELVDVLERDPMLAGGVLRQSRSAAYASRVPPASLDQAVMRLGFRRVRDIVWQVIFRGRVFRSSLYQGPMDSLRRHSIATAHAARLLASRTGVSADNAFLGGLMHDVGLAAAILALAGHASRRRRPVDIATIQGDLRDFHEEAGAIVARLWNFPLELRFVIGHHHDPDVEGYDDPLAAVVCLGQQIAMELGAGVELVQGAWFEEPDPRGLARARLTLDIDEDGFEQLRDEAEPLLRTVLDEDAAASSAPAPAPSPRTADHGEAR
jgi:HD-like signal output (HDOD) protein